MFFRFLKKKNDSNAKVVNFNVFNIKYPVTAIISIFHRISGILLFCLVYFLLSLIYFCIYYKISFLSIVSYLDNVIVKFFIWILLTLFFGHFVSGVRHIMSDFGFIGDNFIIGRITAYLSFLFIGVFLILLGALLYVY